MNLADIERLLEEVRGFAVVDNEMAHLRQDQLLCGVLETIALGADDPAALAAAALKVNDIKYDRWYA